MLFVLGLADDVERLGRSLRRLLAAEVDILGHADVGVAELVGDLPDGQPALIHQRRRRLAERVAGHPLQAQRVQDVGATPATGTA
jgi:hypothetical protein